MKKTLVYLMAALALAILATSCRSQKPIKCDSVSVTQAPRVTSCEAPVWPAPAPPDGVVYHWDPDKGWVEGPAEEPQAPKAEGEWEFPEDYPPTGAPMEADPAPCPGPDGLRLTPLEWILAWLCLLIFIILIVRWIFGYDRV